MLVGRGCPISPAEALPDGKTRVGTAAPAVLVHCPAPRPNMELGRPSPPALAVSAISCAIPASHTCSLTLLLEKQGQLSLTPRGGGWQHLARSRCLVNKVPLIVRTCFGRWSRARRTCPSAVSGKEIQAVPTPWCLPLPCSGNMAEREVLRSLDRPGSREWVFMWMNAFGLQSSLAKQHSHLHPPMSVSGA